MQKVLVVIDANGQPRVFSGSPDVQVLVLDERVREGEAALTVAGAEYSMAAVLDAIAVADEQAVEHAFSEAAPQLKQSSVAGDWPAPARAQLRNLGLAFERTAKG